MKVGKYLHFHELLFPWDHIGPFARTQEFPLYNNPTQRKWGTMVFMTIHTFIT